MSMLRDNNLNCFKQKSRMVSGIFCLETFVFFDSNLLCNPLNNNKIQISCCFQWNKDTKMKYKDNRSGLVKYRSFLAYTPSG